MTDQEPDPDPTDLDTVENLAALQGDALPEDQDAVLEPDEIEGVRQPTRTELDQGDPIPVPDGTIDPEDLQGFADTGLREGETDDPGVAAQEGIPWVPPTDPPFVPDREAQDGIAVAAGVGASADAEPFDDDHRESEDVDGLDLTERIRAAVRADAATADLVDRISIITVDSRAIVRGTVDTLFDADSLVSVIERVAGIDEVVDETDLEV